MSADAPRAAQGRWCDAEGKHISHVGDSAEGRWCDLRGEHQLWPPPGDQGAVSAG